MPVINVAALRIFWGVLREIPGGRDVSCSGFQHPPEAILWKPMQRDESSGLSVVAGNSMEIISSVFGGCIYVIIPKK
jgi:hypothetical protein